MFATEGHEILRGFRNILVLAVDTTTQCVFCIESQAKKAADAGATKDELTDIAWVSATAAAPPVTASVSRSGGWLRDTAAAGPGTAHQPRTPPARAVWRQPAYGQASHAYRG